MSDPHPNAESSLLEAFLANHDATCPSCGYELRGGTSAVCPECGQALALGIQNRDALSRRRGLLVLILAWLLLAGGMNAYRGGRGIYDALQAQQSFAPPYLLNLPGFTIGSPPVTPNAVTTTEIITSELELTFPPGPTTPTAPPLEAAADASGFTLQRQLTSPDAASTAPSNFALRIQGTPQLSIQTMTTPGNLSWSTITWVRWVELGWWMSLALAAATALLLIAVNRHRETSKKLARSLSLIAWLGFCGYFTYHIVNFVRDVI